MKKSHEFDQIIDRAAEQIRSSRIPQQEADAIAVRVWSRLQAADPAAGNEVDESRPIRGCDDYQQLIPGFLAGTLSKSRYLLVESHTRECLPCRKVLNVAREGGSAPTLSAAAMAGRRSPYLRWAMAAALVGAVGLGSWTAFNMVSLEGQGAVVEASDGQVFRLAALGEASLSPGAVIDLGERIRTGTGESALIRLQDGSLIEIRERSALSVEANRRGTTIDLERGSVIVRAAPQDDGHLYVATGDCLVSVTGTIFSVNHGTKGSRISVIEGEVVVDAGGRETILHPGQQTATHMSLAMIPVAEDISWSQDVDQYIDMLSELTALRRALEEELTRPELRYSSRLMDRVPADTAIYVALPNLAETIAEADRILRERIADSRLLSQWWESQEQLQGFGTTFDSITDKLAEFGGYLGDEVVVTARMSGGSEPSSPLVLAELRDADGLRRFVEQEMAQHADTDSVAIAFVDTIDEAVAEAELYVWMDGDTLIAAADLDDLRAALSADTESAGGFAVTSFGQRVAEAYREGAGVVIAVDISSFAASMIASEGAGGNVLEATGLLSAEHFLLEQKWVDGRTQHSAVLGFDGPRQGVAAWLAEPAPMGALDFISPDAKFAAVLLMQDPSVMLADVMRIAALGDPEIATGLAAQESEFGISIAEDVAVAFGGEIAVAIDGPLLPTPSWKLILEVYDPTRVQFILGQLATQASALLVQEGGDPIELVREESNGRVYFSFSGDKPFHFTFEESYLIAAPNRALLERAIRYRQSGYTLAVSSRFRALLPTDGRDNFSAIFYQDAMSLLGPLAGRIAAQELTDAQREAIAALTAESGPTLGYAYGETDRVVFAANGTMSLLDAGLPSLLGLGMGSFDTEGLFRSMLGSGDADGGSGD